MTSCACKHQITSLRKKIEKRLMIAVLFGDFPHSQCATTGGKKIQFSKVEISIKFNDFSCGGGKEIAWDD